MTNNLIRILQEQSVKGGIKYIRELWIFKKVLLPKMYPNIYVHLSKRFSNMFPF
jgi:hypothetical protein